MNEFIGTSAEPDMAITGTAPAEDKSESKSTQAVDDDDPFAVNIVQPKRRRKKKASDDDDDDGEDDEVDWEEGESPRKRPASVAHQQERDQQGERGVIEISESESPMIGVFQAFTPTENKLNWLLIAVPLHIFSLIAGNTEMSFVFSMIAIMPLALPWPCNRRDCLRTSESLGLLNATFGNAVEIIIATLAIYTAATNADQAETMITVVQASLVGSILETYYSF